MRSLDVQARTSVQRTGATAVGPGWRSLRLAFWSAVATVGLTVVTAVLAVTTPPRSGPLCQEKVCVTAPYTDVAAFVPRDYLWLYPALALQLAFLLLVAVVAGRALRDRPDLALAALAFTVVGAGLLVADYGLQLVVLQPSLLAGEPQALSLLSQYNPHGVFIGLEDIGYAAIAVGFLFLGALLTGRRRLVRITRWVFVIGGVATWLALVGLAVGYGAGLEYRFELAGISLNWLVLAAAGGLLAAEFRHAALLGGAGVEERDQAQRGSAEPPAEGPPRWTPTTIR